MSDPNSFANYQKVYVKSFHLAVSAHFDRQVLAGHVDLTVATRQDTNQLVLDTRDLTISRITELASSTVLNYTVKPAHAAFGSALVVDLPASLQHAGNEGVVRIEYETSPNSSAIQWLPPAQTAGKVHPYLFTQCQAIHARALLPIQDTPANKCPYTGSVTVPAPLVGLMSALPDGHEDVTVNEQKWIRYAFKQPVPMPSYLVAIAVGHLERRDIGPRSCVWSEPEMVEKGAYEFADTERFIQAAENIVGPYVWGRYDILLLPPSFPYGGMENPCLTFVTPTLLAGDRSLANVVAHEIAHSWMGNLVSPTTWEHFWMNEGFTVFLERKIIRAMFGNQEAHLHAIGGWKALCDSVDRYGHDHPYTKLVPELDNVDPDDAFSSVPYEKGFNFLFYLEQLVGGHEQMDPFLLAHCEKYKFANTDSYQWREFFLSYFRGKVSEEKLNSIDWDMWYKGTGLPPQPKFDDTLVKTAQDLAHSLCVESKVNLNGKELEKWNSHQVVVFLEKVSDYQLQELRPLAQDAQRTVEVKSRYANICVELDRLFHLTQSKNAEIRFRWFDVCIRSEYDAVFPAVVEFLSEVGRMKFVRPLYRDLFTSTKGRQVALDTFQKYRTRYHNIAAKMVARDLQLEQ